MTSPLQTPPQITTAQDLGVGARFSLHPHCDDFVEVILGSLRDARDAGLTEALEVQTDEVSTYLASSRETPEQHLAEYIAHVLGAASRRSRDGHVVAHVLLSRGCPGEAACDLRTTTLPAAEPIALELTGVQAVAQWSLYPLIDGSSDAGDHMPPIDGAIAMARDRGVAGPATHYATPLRGDIADILATAIDAWTGVGASIPHVVTHLTISVGSPSTVGGVTA